LPATGVKESPVQVIAVEDFRLLWSKVEWPFDPAEMQKNAVEFHHVVRHIFDQTAVIPFRLLSVFEDESALATFAREHHENFLADLEQLKDSVQMECVIYPAPASAQLDRSSGTAYLQQKAVAMRSAEGFAQALKNAVAHLSSDVRVRESKNGTRIFVLVKRGHEDEFRQVVSALPLPEHLSRRMSGPWPAAEFLSEQVKAPQIASQKIVGDR
jgi:hypothetical protein